MNDLQELNEKYLQQKQLVKQGNQDLIKINEEINQAKVQLLEVSERISEIDRLLSNAKNGIRQRLSAEEFLSLKSELNHKQIEMNNLNELIEINQYALREAGYQKRDSERAARDIAEDLSTMIAERAVKAIIMDNGDKLKEIAHATLAKHGFGFRGKNDDYDLFYKQVGKVICGQVFTDDSGSPARLKIEQAIAERDLLIEHLA
jgi:hypothetical protein